MTSQAWLDNDRISRSHLHPSSPQTHHSVGNVFHLLARREVSPRTKCCPQRRWGKARKHINEPGVKGEAIRDARRGLYSWVEAESMGHLSGEYCALMPSPRSTIAAAFSPDGKKLASTHGDHTVKLIDSESGRCLKVFNGHRRTPWVVRFHPRHPTVLASGSLDHEVRLWDANTSECIGFRNFYRPIASIAFHAEGDILAVASGHKLYLWHYNQRGEASSPTIVLKTRRSLRAIHFHPHGAPLLLTAEVNDLDSSDSSVAWATSVGGLHYPPPTIYMANVHSSDCHSLAADLPLMPLPFFCPNTFARDGLSETTQIQNRLGGVNRIQAGSSASMQFQVDANVIEQDGHSASPMEMSPEPNRHDEMQETLTNYPSNAMLSSINDTPIDTGLAAEVQYVEDYPRNSSSDQGTSVSQPGPTGLRNHVHHSYPSRNSGLHSIGSTSNSLMGDWELPETSFPRITNRSLVAESSSSGDRFLHTHFSSTPEVGASPVLYNNPHERISSTPIISRVKTELSVSLAATAAAELPCTVKLRIWPHDIQHPCAPLSDERCRLTIPHAVLCSEMGTHFSPCGKYLAACVACMLPEMETDLGLVSDYNQDADGTPTSPTRHPISARQIIYELRIYSLEEPTFGLVLVSRAIRAAHCLTSIQFSPTSGHILLAYGRRHCSLLKSIVINGETSVPIYTVLEVYRVSDLELVSVLPSAEDEVNVASFHPLAGGGLVYGTKEGKLRVLQYDRAHCNGNAGSNSLAEAKLLEIPAYALEC